MNASFHSHRHRRGFTLVELLVVIAIIGTLVGLLLPAVQAAREAARRSSCTNNLKQIGVGLHAFHDGNRRFPYGHIYPQDNLNSDLGAISNKLFGSWIREILPYMELNDVYKKYNGTLPWWSGTNQTVRSYKLPAFLCPSDRDVPTFNTTNDFGARGNYAANTGIGKWDRSLPWSAAYQSSLTTRGPFLFASYTTTAKITDGLSKTAAVAEIRKSPNNDSRGALFADTGCVQYTHDYLPNATTSDWTERCAGDATTPCNTQGLNGFYQLTAKSRHSGGVNLLLMDGAVLFVDNGVDVNAWQAAASPSGGESTSLP